MKRIRLEIRLTEYEKQEMIKCAKILGMDLSKYIRETMSNRNKRVLKKNG